MERSSKNHYGVLVTFLVLFVGLGLALSLPKELPTPEEAPRPTAMINVPFTTQAPHADWGDPYQEACEEAALLMVQAHLTGQELWTEMSDKKLVALTSWIEDQDMAQDITIRQLADVAETYYGRVTKILRDPTIDQLKYQIDQGNPVIVPAAGRKLGNPNFSGDGPWYHMLVIVGYDETHFITNDPGTRKGEGYRYSYKTLYDAIHDWTGVKEEIEKGPKVALVVY